MREFKRDRGYITIAQRSGETDYLRMAYALALSLKKTQSEVSHLTVVVTPGTKVPTKYADVFDEVIEIPWGDDAEYFAWKIHNKWKVYHLSPYKETVLLDADMIFPTDVSHWWDTMELRDVLFTTRPMTYRGTPIVPNAYRQHFIENDLPMVYTAFMYFRWCDMAHELFDTVKVIYKNWHTLYTNYQLRRTNDDVLAAMNAFRNKDRWGWTHFFQNFPKDASGDLAFAMATKILGIEDATTTDFAFPTFTHMKTLDQGLSYPDADWRKIFSYSLTREAKLRIGDYQQQYPFHYAEKSWLTDDIVEKLERPAHG
jgi:hypothetical protein